MLEEKFLYPIHVKGFLHLSCSDKPCEAYEAVRRVVPDGSVSDLTESRPIFVYRV